MHTSEGEFLNMTFTETHLDADKNVIFGLPWFREYAPQFDWTSGQFVLPTLPNTSEQEVPAVVRQHSSDIVPGSCGQPRKLYVCRNEYAELFLVRVSFIKMDDNVPDWLRGHINEYAVSF